MIALTLVSLLALTPEEQLDGAEIGDATQFIAFQSGGRYLAERNEPDGGKTVAAGQWRLQGEDLQVKVTSCAGPSCESLGRAFSSSVAVVAERAMIVRSKPADAPLASGSYYCRFQGCEKRLGVELVTRGARPLVMKYLVDFLIDKNRTRDVTVVWWGKRLAPKQPLSTLTYCRREEERGQKAAQLVADDLAELPWIGKLEPRAGPSDCLYDVRLVVGDDVQLPARQ